MASTKSNAFLKQMFCFGLYFVYVNYNSFFGASDAFTEVLVVPTTSAVEPDGVNKKTDKTSEKTSVMTDDDSFKPIFEAEYFLYDLSHTNHVKTKGTYGHVKAHFCKLSWKRQKRQPNLVPRYSDVIRQSSKACKGDQIVVRLSDIVSKARSYDKANPTKVHSLEKAGFIYHESRCGSTLAANMITVADPDASRLYSEPKPLTSAATTQNKRLVRDVMYLLGRSNDFNEKRVFYKMRSTLANDISAMPKNVPWVFFYRNPQDVLASHFNPTEAKRVICLNSRKHPHKNEVQMATQYGKDHKSLPDADVCALRLSSIVQSVLDQHNRTQAGHFVNYESLPNSVWETVLPDYFNLDVNDEMIERMKEISGVYSKTSWTRKEIKWDDEGQEKADLKKSQRKAVKKYMSKQYEFLEELAGSSPEAA
mmetsp:Transcript_18911/g.27969  ORF Transcript_18911/g.27969 Transcript_18911/m.27969 type:complete len:422 (-) Transcript_18911:777-2042(-)|eukprot:CAMPEP_0194066574 /NCGR_PEP_ID=MMETSP0009_2-20130614/86098_1 /TAXON_ID=210454 /ORGANISM="Grammatophora oceanica, Strain CCMP 410" /LENGTH=421 /DNA_ID=CAMNT_0038719541 /DNA_START=47 /DNA_END=1312 /DNA_ORIENTATION=+